MAAVYISVLAVFLFDRTASRKAEKGRVKRESKKE
jgi:hypothetical protein